jgi:Pectate lyase superfamily protein/Secretion system C-terminal sorting domain
MKRINFYFLSFLLMLLVLPSIKLNSQTFENAPNSGALNVKDYGVKGDGITDDTEAFNQFFLQNFTYCGGFSNNFRFVYIPNGTYLVTGQIFFQRWITLQGQSQSGTIIKLKENSSGFQNPASPKAVLRCRFLGNSCSPYDGAENSSFGNYIQNLSVEVGAGNPGAIGVQYNTHNSGAMRNVTIKSDDGGGVTGLDMSETEFGPGLVSDVQIDGFDYGIKTPFNVSHGTFSNIFIRNQRVLGMLNGMPVSIYNFTSNNRVTAIQNEGGIAQLVLIKASLTGGESANRGIVNKNQARLNLRNVQCQGYANLLQEDGVDKAGNQISEYITGEIISIFPSETGHLKLPIKDPPATFYEPVSNWAYADPSQDDDTRSIQDAMNSGASTVYFSFTGGYRITNTITVPATVRRIVGMNATINADAGIFGTTKPIIKLVGSTNVPISVEFVSTQAYPNRANGIEVSTTRPVNIVSCQGYISNINNTAEATGGDLFIEDQGNDIPLTAPQNVWLKQWNPENNPYYPEKPLRIYMTNNGGKVWILGLKTEAISISTLTTNGGKTEVLGGFFRDFVSVNNTPFFRTEESSVSASFVTYDYQGCGNTRTLMFEETRNGEKRQYIGNGCAKNVGLYAGFAQNIALPLELLDFTATMESECSVNLNWKTAVEENVQSFEIERSEDGKEFEKIAEVPARNAGESENNYFYSDISFLPKDKTLYYRLKIMDKDGGFTYSPVRTITITASQLRKIDDKVTIAPNPASDYIMVSTNQMQRDKMMQIQIINAQGNIIKSFDARVDGSKKRIDVQSLISGIYKLRIVSERKIINGTFIKK